MFECNFLLFILFTSISQFKYKVKVMMIKTSYHLYICKKKEVFNVLIFSHSLCLSLVIVVLIPRKAGEVLPRGMRMADLARSTSPW